MSRATPTLLRSAAAAVVAVCTGSCAKVPIFDVNAFFSLADTSWFEEEQTLFLFYEVQAEQGLGEPSLIELTYTTDAERVDWTPLEDLPQVHTHLDVDCGAQALCGSTSVAVPLEPRDVAVRLRYHRDGELDLKANTVFNVVRTGDPATHRSLAVYGVFNETNDRVQWRSRHQFPTLRNEEAEDYGLRRYFQVDARTAGTRELSSAQSPYGYGASCPSFFAPIDMAAVETSQRAVFDPDLLPADAGEDAAICAQATVTDATGTFTTGAVARKNPEVRPAFPILRSPVEEATPIPFFLGPCDTTISADHEDMQRQRLQLEGVATTCIDDWESDGWVDRLVVDLTEAVEAERAAGRDMVLTIALNREETGVALAVEEAIAQILPEERHRSSPRLAGAFVFDSEIRGLSRTDLKPETLWCPAILPGFPGAEVPDASSLSCAIAPDNPDLDLGPFSFGTLPLLPSRTQYLDFIDTYSKAQAGKVTDFEFRTPEFSTTADHVDIGEFGVVTFLDDEFISAEPDDSFSYCITDDAPFVVFRSAFMATEEFDALLDEACTTGQLPAEFCDYGYLGLLPIQWLSTWHEFFEEDTYELGLFWDFPYLLHVDFELVAAGSASAFGFSVPFGIAQSGETFLGSWVWTAEEFSLEDELLQCERFCGHPTFDSAGVYHVNDDFSTTYATSCYRPVYPKPGDSGFPRDP